MNIPNITFNHDKNNKAEFEIIELSSLYERTTLSHSPEAPHRVSFFMVIHIERGEGKHMVDFEKYPFSAGSMIFVQREQVHAFDFSSKPQGKVLLFTQTFLDHVHINMRLPNYTPTHLNHQHTPLLTLDLQNNQRSHTLINEMIAEIKLSNSDPLIIMYLFSALALLLHRLRPEMRHDKLSTEQSIKLARFFTLMQKHFQQIRDANWYANQINTTYKTLNQVCKLATGLTAKQMIDAFVVIEIKRRLIITNTASQQIAYDFGFEDASNFVKYFKKQTSLTPAQFQKHYIKTAL
ncbi:helix-turn-helix domain-containing protein [Aliivibrio fischeri]|uniref:AraC family transcriptional regulator n=1 Tax=Aliivibrio fischeri TaxID=668 RepID=UPI0012D8F613|nr:helix-turn-helix transcriptional regulator [Aliivibrio fischeri]MUK62330.1 helix-turn-helix domain-containing protein [Aliivibrio fischeri]MUL21400.1 helix-turn-helix domain-containing protein [Aliivibrio fischeri]MUL23577.1 helix-turn-helix domain-containing protein [Aliivibrio fischeri]